MKFSAVILAGGKSTRMGHDKALLVVRGKPLIERQIELVRELGATEIFISGRTGTDYQTLACPVLTDDFKDAGPLAGIERALRAMTTPLLLVLAVDMPRMSRPQLQMLLAHCAENRGAIPRFPNGIEPLAAVYPQSASRLLTQLLESRDYAARHFAERCVELNRAGFIDLPETHLEEFQNWNTPLDISRTPEQ